MDPLENDKLVGGIGAPDRGTRHALERVGR